MGAGDPILDREKSLGRAHAAAIAVCAANMLAYFAIGIVMPVLPLYMRADLGSSDLTVGVVMASYAVTTLVGRPVGGRWGDRRGYRQPAVVGALLIIAGTAAYGLWRSAIWLLVCRLVVGFGEGLSQASCITWAVSLTPPRRRGVVLSYAGVTGWAGVALGAMIGDAVAGAVGYRATFWIGCAAPALGVATLASIPSPARLPGDAGLSLMRLAQKFVRQGAAYALVTVGYAGVLTFGSLLFRARGAASPALLLHAFLAGVIGVRLLGASLPVRLGPARTASLCAAAQAAGLLGVAWIPSGGWPVAGAGALAGLAFGMSFPSLALDALGRVSEAERGVAIGVVSAFFDVGMAAAGVGLGWIAERAGYPAAFVAAAGCAAIAATLIDRTRAPAER